MADFFNAPQKERLQQRAQLAARVAAEQATKVGVVVTEAGREKQDLEDCRVMLDILHPWNLTNITQLPSSSSSIIQYIIILKWND